MKAAELEMDTLQNRYRESSVQYAKIQSDLETALSKQSQVL